MFYLYILYNQTIDKYYVGIMSNIENRLNEHNSSHHKSKYTRKQKGSWIIVYSETYNSITEARNRELEIKRWKSRKKIIQLVEQSRL